MPVVHTQNKKENNIDKLACSEFWKERDSYRQLQNSFYEYMVSHNFELERGLPVEETTRKNVNRLSKKRDEKILEEIIKRKDNIITEFLLYIFIIICYIKTTELSLLR